MLATKGTKITKFGELILRNLRDLRGEFVSSGHV